MFSYYTTGMYIPSFSQDIKVNGCTKVTKLLKMYTSKEGKINKIIVKYELDDISKRQIHENFSVDANIEKEYFLCNIKDNNIIINAKNENCVIYAISEIISCINEKLAVSCLFSNARCNFRCLKVYLPSNDKIEYFKKLVDYISDLRFNAIMIEVGGAMEYKFHPEINEGWVKYADIFRNQIGKSVEIQNSFLYEKNSIHWENGGGYFLSQSKVKQLIDYCKEKSIEVIPEVPLLTHSDYILYSHKELAERKEDPYPDTYCPSNELTYKIVFDILSEVIEVFNPKIINIGHDEWYSMCLCDKCKGKDPTDIFCQDIIKIYSFLKQKGIITAIWGDKLLNCIGKTGITWGGSKLVRYCDNDFSKPIRQIIPSTYLSIEKLPKDILIFNWYWMINNGYADEFQKYGYNSVYGNFFGSKFSDWNKKSKIVEGFEISNWSMLEENHIQRNGLFFEMLYSYLMVWDKDFDENKFKENTLKCFDMAFMNKNKKIIESGKYIEIIHGTDEYIEHSPFEDGNLIDYKNDKLGDYIIEFENERKMISVYYGINIGNSSINFERQEHPVYSCKSANTQLFETANTCNLVVCGKKLYYKYIISLIGKTRPISIKFLPNKNRKIDIKDIKIYY